MRNAITTIHGERPVDQNSGYVSTEGNSDRIVHCRDDARSGTSHWSETTSTSTVFAAASTGAPNLLSRGAAPSPYGQNLLPSSISTPKTMYADFAMRSLCPSGGNSLALLCRNVTASTEWAVLARKGLGSTGVLGICVSRRR